LHRGIGFRRLRGSVALHQPSLVLRTSAHPGGGAPGLPRSVQIVDVELRGVLSEERLQAGLRAGFANSADRIDARVTVEPPARTAHCPVTWSRA